MPLFPTILTGLPVIEISGNSEIEVKHVCADSRKVQEQDIFVAIKGKAFDGHNAVAEAIDRGAIAIVGERYLQDINFGKGRVEHDICYVRVSESRQAYAHMLLQTLPGIADAIRDIRFYAVTGTNGKTTVATILDQLFYNSRRTGFIGTTGISYRNPAGDLIELHATHTTPDAKDLYEIIVDMHLAGVDTIVMEASSHALEQYRVFGIPFHIAIFTNLTHDHLDYHGSMENYARSKKRLFDSLDINARAIVNGDDEWVLFLTRDCKAQIIRCGISTLNDIQIIDEQVSTNGSSFSLIEPHVLQNATISNIDETQPLTLTIPLIGRFNILNAALCAVSAIADGEPVSTVRSALTTVHGPRGRMERIALDNGCVAVIDYAHTPDALDKVLRTLREVMDPNQRLHVVFGCGGDRDKTKRPEMGFIACELADEVWITSDNPRTEDPKQIISDIFEGTKNSRNKNVHSYVDRREAIEHALTTSEPHDMILIAGKGHEEYQIIGSEKLPFSDREVITSAF